MRSEPVALTLGEFERAQLEAREISTATHIPGDTRIVKVERRKTKLHIEHPDNSVHFAGATIECVLLKNGKKIWKVIADIYLVNEFWELNE